MASQKKTPSRKTAPAKKSASKKSPVKKSASTKRSPATKKVLKASAPATGAIAHPAAGEVGLRVRMYRVGFGDFFLLTVPSGDGPQHILIDCGVTPGKTHKGDIGTIKDAVADMAIETKKKLALIIMTHRHQDHIIGFSRCIDDFKDFKVDAIWMPVWESEYDSQASKFQLALTSLALNMQQHLALAAGDDGPVDEMLGMLQNATGVDPSTGPMMAAAGGAAAAKSGKGGGTNAASLALLKTGLNVKPEYYQQGKIPTVPKGLAAAGLAAQILGPPPINALDFMKLMDLTKVTGQYLGESASGDTGTFEPFGPGWRAQPNDFPPSVFREWAPRGKGARRDPKARYSTELEKAVNDAQPDMLLTAVKSLDSFLNNQSLVVLFTFKGKKLLFAGDAQGGNWEYWMYGGTPTKTPSLDKLVPESNAILANLDFYKVGHHGSTNATPVSAVEAMGGVFASMCSTQEDSFGSKDRGTEVPREPLLEALAKKSDLVRSDQMAVTVKTNPVPAVANVTPPNAKGGRFVIGPIYLDYFL
jgi:beta-lactamase superfamily II metal-dependent hydrolase